ncbi:phage baseplate protein [Leptolyngbya sp. DQ-M1]|uniref:T4 family baseplate hub assembly chaperone n=1 Tax=Leptolyngbya sp. DQ-M1 TaxID=2933920 RepID=UPI00329886CA
MHALSAREIVQVWEAGQSQHPIDRALALLACGSPELSVPDLVTLTVGQRDAYLLTLRELTFGSKLNSVAACPQCREQLEFDLDVPDIRVADLERPIQPEYALTTEGLNLRFRLPNSQDLAAIVGSKDVAIAAATLVQRCVLAVDRGDKSEIDEPLPQSAIAALAEYMTECDPQAEIYLALTCPACGHAWSVLFDIVDFFWTELSAEAQRLLQEVHLLARFYGWSEADILSMSAVRRQFYLNLIGS